MPLAETEKKSKETVLPMSEQKLFLSSNQVLNPYRGYSNLESGLCKWKRQRRKNEIIIGVIGK